MIKKIVILPKSSLGSVGLSYCKCGKMHLNFGQDLSCTILENELITIIYKIICFSLFLTIDTV